MQDSIMSSQANMNARSPSISYESPVMAAKKQKADMREMGFWVDAEDEEDVLADLWEEMGDSIQKHLRDKKVEKTSFL